MLYWSWARLWQWIRRWKAPESEMEVSLARKVMMVTVFGSYLMAIVLSEAQRALGLARSRPSRAL